MAGPTQDLPFPCGDKSLVWVKLGGYCPASLGAVAIDCFAVPWDAYVRKVYYSYLKVGNDPDEATVASTGSAAKTIVADPTLDGSLTAVEQTLHADVAKDAYALVKGDEISLTVDTDAGESGYVFAYIGLRPKYAGPTV